MSSSGRKQLEEHLKEQERSREHQRELQKEQGALQEAFNANGELSRNFINELLSADDIAVGGAEDLQDTTIAKLQNMVSRDWVLANMTDAQEHDIRFKLEVLKYKIIGIHPPEESVITGPTRAFLFDNPSEEMDPLTQQQRLLIDELIESLKGRLTRGRGGFERKQMNTSIAETRTQNNSEESSDGTLSGFFS